MPWFAAVAALATLGTGIAGAMSQPNMGKLAAQAERKKQERISAGTKEVDDAFAGYDPTFYANREKAYLNFALPEVETQHRGAEKSLVYGLANKGLLSSSMAKSGFSDLARTHASAQQAVGDEAVNQAQDLKQKVAMSRQGVLDQLYQSADPGQAKNAAVTAASGFKNPSPFSPLANMFSNITNQYVTNQLLSSFKKGVGSTSGNADTSNPQAAALGSFSAFNS